MPLSKEQSRARWRELQDLVLSWDPIGVAAIPDWPRDEYNCLIDPVMRMLERNATSHEIAAALIATVQDHMGLDADPAEVAQFAAKAKVWYAERWASLSA